MKLFLTDYTEKELKDCIARAYDSKFDTEEIAPLAKADGAYYLEPVSYTHLRLSTILSLNVP